MTASPARGPAALDEVAPSAERARSVAARAGAALCIAGRAPARPLAHATTAGGQVLLLVPAEGEATATLDVSPDRDVSALLMVSDRAPVSMRDPVRGQVWMSGWLTAIAPRDQRAAALEFAEVRPAGGLLDVGAGTILLRLDLAEVVLREGELSTEIGPADYSAADPDPLLQVEARMLTHIDRCHPEVIAALSRLLPAGTVGPGDVVRPLALDRFGYRLRVQRPGGHTDARVAFARPVSGAGELHAATRQLIGRAC